MICTVMWSVYVMFAHSVHWPGIGNVKREYINWEQGFDTTAQSDLQEAAPDWESDDVHCHVVAVGSRLAAADMA